jgi:hypothetical protein
VRRCGVPPRFDGFGFQRSMGRRQPTNLDAKCTDVGTKTREDDKPRIFRLRTCETRQSRILSRPWMGLRTGKNTTDASQTVLRPEHGPGYVPARLRQMVLRAGMQQFATRDKKCAHFFKRWVNFLGNFSFTVYSLGHRILNGAGLVPVSIKNLEK